MVEKQRQMTLEEHVAELQQQLGEQWAVRARKTADGHVRIESTLK